MKVSIEKYEEYWVAKVDTVLYVENGLLNIIFNDTKHQLNEGTSIVVPQFNRLYLETKCCVLHYIPLFDEKEDIDQLMKSAFHIEEE